MLIVDKYGDLDRHEFLVYEDNREYGITFDENIGIINISECIYDGQNRLTDYFVYSLVGSDVSGCTAEIYTYDDNGLILDLYDYSDLNQTKKLLNNLSRHERFTFPVIDGKLSEYIYEDCLPRPDYEKLLDITESFPDKKYQVLCSRSKSYFYGFAKVVDRKTRIIDDEVEIIPELGVWLDIFPYDGKASKSSFNNKFCFYLNKLRAAAVYRKFPKDKGANYLIWMLCRLIGYRPFLNIYEHYCKKVPYGTSKYIGLISDMKDCHRHNLFSDIIKVKFEGKDYNAPIGYDQILRTYYGDYMQLPPEEQRVTHHIKAVIV